MLIIGLTGGIGSGKTAVAGLFAELGVPVIDTDQLAREVVSPGEPLLQQLAEEFGRSILSPGGELNRRHLRDEIFTDPVRRKRLEEYLHPAIKARLLERLQSLDAPYCVVAVPLLIEAGWQNLVDRVAVVDCPQELQRERVVARDGTGLEQVEAIMATQLPRAERLAYADDVIDNSGSPEELRQQVDGLHHQYLALAAA